jgi:competence protein ComEA
VRVSDLLRPSPAPTWRDRLETVTDFVRAAPRLSAAIAVAVVLAGVLGLFLFHRPQPRPELRLPRAEAEAAPAASPSTTTGEVVVHVAGAVARPGVVRLAGPGRVIDAIAAAGGPSPDADLNLINLAAKVADGDRVYLPRRGEAPPPAPTTGGPAGSATASSGPVDLNSATPEQLDALPGVGPATAKAIVDYRTRHGRFRTVDDLLSVTGIGPAKLANLKSLVRV